MLLLLLLLHGEEPGEETVAGGWSGSWVSGCIHCGGAFRGRRCCSVRIHSSRSAPRAPIWRSHELQSKQMWCAKRPAPKGDGAPLRPAFNVL